MNDIETVLDQWREYIDDLPQWEAERPEDQIIGWAHRELVRRGIEPRTQQRLPCPSDNSKLCNVAFYRSAEWHQYYAPTLLGAYLAAIKDTEPEQPEESQE